MAVERKRFCWHI